MDELSALTSADEPPVRKRRHFILNDPNICQDRLGTNIGKIEGKRRFLQESTDLAGKSAGLLAVWACFEASGVMALLVRANSLWIMLPTCSSFCV